MNDAALQDAIAHAVAHESGWSREPGDGWGIHLQDPPPWNRLFGPVHGRGPVSGVVAVDGRTVASWGEPERADLTFSVAKTYLAMLAGVAFDRGLLRDVDAPVGASVRGIGFDAGRNAEVTWKQLLQQTSEWEGACFGIPEQVDRWRTVQFQAVPAAGTKGGARPLQRPGSYWEYNDVRINQLSLALLHLFRQPLPEVFREAITRPAGASEGWSWVGYDHAQVTIDGVSMPSVPGGSHWGAGVSISARDQARIGQLLLDGGRCGDRQLISSEWIARMRTPCEIAPFYGYLVWLNTDRKVFPSAPASSWFAIGAGSSFTWIEPERRLVCIVRWLDGEHADGFFDRVLAAFD
jgi:CubicO group peptidase (beta-lactamase class C family)